MGSLAHTSLSFEEYTAADRMGRLRLRCKRACRDAPTWFTLGASAADFAFVTNPKVKSATGLRSAASTQGRIIGVSPETPPSIPPPPPSENPWAKKLGPVGPIALLLAKGKFLLTALFKLKFLLSFAAFIGLYWAAFGLKFGVGFAVLILLHEMGHFLDIKRRGLPAEMPVFLPGLGAYVRWQALGVPLETRAAVSLAGPLAGFLASVACAALWWQTGNPLWAALARVGAVLNLLNLIPIWVLDGGQAVLALSKMERIILLTASLALWLLLGQNMFFLVALAAGYQAFFSGDLPQRPSVAITVYFVAVLTALGVMISILPEHALRSR